MSMPFVNFINEFNFFNESFVIDQSYLTFDNYSFFFYLNDYSFYSFLDTNKLSSVYTNSIISFINQTEDLGLSDNLENVTSIYHYSIPNTKLAYPEPFIAAPSFMHSDLWFIHILVYQYWLWFVFVFIIVFFFIMFVCTVRWCNMRVRPRRETRGVSRSKCGDLITACVPVTWATSIIVNESTDAIDYYDGFGTTELVVGIRAYQWGWEYYYPKDIDLNYNIKQNYSSFVGNSLKYEQASGVNQLTNNLWKFYQNKSHDQVITPAYLISLPMDNNKLLNFLNFQDVGSSPVQEINAFKKVKMFSKTNFNNLIFNNDNFSSKYQTLTNLYTNDNLFTDSYLYGLKRQHNFTSNKSVFNNQSTLMDLQAINKINNFNWNFSGNLEFKLKHLNNVAYFKKPHLLSLTNTSLNSNIYFFNYFKNNSLNSYVNSIKNNQFISLINDDSDRKQINYPIFKLFNLRFKKKILNNTNLILNDSEMISKGSNTEIFSNFKNSKSFKIATPFSPNQSISIANRYLRNFVDSKPNYNYSLLLNPINEVLNTSSKVSGLSPETSFYLSASNWINQIKVQKLAQSKVSFDYPYSAVLSNNPYIDSFDFDNLNNSFSEEIPTILQGKEELMPSFLPNIYWNFYWSNSNFNWRLSNSQNYHLVHTLHYLPTFSFYYDYDFRNWQAAELLEDSFWESVYSVYTHDEYTSVANDFYDYSYLDKHLSTYNNFNRFSRYPGKTIEKPLFVNPTNSGSFYSNSFALDDVVSNPTLTLTKDFFIFPVFNSILSIDETYESFKFLNYYYNTSTNLFLNKTLSQLSAYSSFFIFDMFRSDYEDFSWFTDELPKLSSLTSSFKISSIDSNFLSNVNESLFKNFFNFDFFTDYKSLRFNNFINLRAPAKSSIVTYNAIQKVFRTRFDENRSNTKLVDFGYFYNKQAFISSPRTQYEKLLGKNKETFYNVNLYKSNFNLFLNSNYAMLNNLNYYFFDFPFLLALKSDASRYLWLDWFSKWGFYEVQPSSSSRYAIYGMPYFSKSFEFNTINSEALNETETYLLRISRARKNYLPNWVYTPYFYAKHTNWYKNNLFYEIFNLYNNSLTGSYYLLLNMSWYWTKLSLISHNTHQFFPSNSGISSYAKLNWKPQNSVQSYYYSINTLIDILTKREYLYRELLGSTNKIISLPVFLTSNPNNPLINEVKASFLFIDNVIKNNEYSRDVYFNSLNFFNLILLKNFLTDFTKTINVSLLTNYFSYYFFNTNINESSLPNELYKSQYRPLRKGITNMIRLHATGAIAMPIEIRLQILASSKDVIHSWAIPSAGIKIDCVPGYSSHKVMIFLVSGIFWGQCMEICGRYHHWMPIIVYFMKRDLFFLWCTHFVFLSGSNNMWNINDRQYADYARPVSFDKYSWVSELSD